MKPGEPHGPLLIIWDEYTVISRELWEQFARSIRRAGHDIGKQRMTEAVIKAVIAPKSGPKSEA